MYQDWADSLGYDLNIDCFGFAKIMLKSNYKVIYDDYAGNTRNEAIKEAIKQLSKIVNT